MDKEFLEEMRAKLEAIDRKTALHLIDNNETYRAKLLSIDPKAFKGGQIEKDEFISKWDASHEQLVARARAAKWIE
jgi:hypothetical protein